MSSLRVPVFFGSILILVVLVLQNRTPVFQITLLGMRSRPFELGILVAIAVLSGVLLGAILQRTGSRRSTGRARSKPMPTSSYSGPAEFQPFGTTPETPSSDTGEAGPQDGLDAEPMSQASEDATSAKGWTSGASKSWGEQSESEGRFWSQPDKGPGSVTPIQSKRDRKKTRQPADETEPSVVDAEYRLVTPAQPESENGFDDNFFDDFFEEDDA